REHKRNGASHYDEGDDVMVGKKHCVHHENLRWDVAVASQPFVTLAQRVLFECLGSWYVKLRNRLCVPPDIRQIFEWIGPKRLYDCRWPRFRRRCEASLAAFAPCRHFAADAELFRTLCRRRRCRTSKSSPPEAASTEALCTNFCLAI